MVLLSENALDILNDYIAKYSAYRLKGEYGISSFWYWVYQVKGYLNSLDIDDTPLGNNLTFTMPYWGGITYSRIIAGKDICVVVNSFSFNHSYFLKWINHKSLSAFPYVVTDGGYGYKILRHDDSNKETIQTPQGEILFNPIFDDIIGFHHSSSDYDTIHAIGFIGARVYSIAMDGKITLLHTSKSAYLSSPHLYYESKVQNKEIAHEKHCSKAIITETDVVDMVRESVYRLIHEATINAHTYPTEKQVGNWKCIDGIYWEQEVKGCPEKGLCYDVRMYDNTNLSNGEWETYALWQRVDNGRYFYASIVTSPNKESNQTEWKTTPLTKVPSEILKDFYTLPQPPERVLTNQISRDSADSLQNVIDESSHKGRRIKAYKKICVDTDGGRWPDGMSDQDIQIQNNYMKRYGVTSCSELLPLALKLLSHNKVAGYEHYLSRRRDARNQKQSSEFHRHN